MQYLRRTPDAYTLRVTFGVAPQRLPAGATATAPGQLSQQRSWTAIAELDWTATDDTQVPLRKLNSLTAAVRAEKPQDAQEVRLEVVLGAAGTAARVFLHVEDTPVVPLRLDLGRTAGSLGAPSVRRRSGVHCTVRCSVPSGTDL
jgi:hypothetical protein